MGAAVFCCIKAWIDPFILCSENFYFSDKVHSQNGAFLHRALQVCIISTKPSKTILLTFNGPQCISNASESSYWVENIMFLITLMLNQLLNGKQSSLEVILEMPPLAVFFDWFVKCQQKHTSPWFMSKLCVLKSQAASVCVLLYLVWFICPERCGRIFSL